MAASKQLRSIVLNEKERKVFEAFPRAKVDGAFQFVKLEYLAGEAFGSAKKGTSPKSKGNSWVRNSLRKLVNLKVVKMKGKRAGLYALTGNDLPEPPAELLAKEAERAEKANTKGAKAAKKPAKKKTVKKSAKAKGKKAKVKKGSADVAEAAPAAETASDDVDNEKDDVESEIEEEEEDDVETEDAEMRASGESE